VDKQRDALKSDERAFWQAPERAAEVLAQASEVVITGSALVEGGLEVLLVAANEARTVVLAGPRASPWPVQFFARGVYILGGLHVQDGERILQLVSEGGSGYFFKRGAEKICLVRES
jgi:uncharacterized protein (DUF4213/DUF364 family)